MLSLQRRAAQRRLQRGVSQCLTPGFVLSLSGCSRWKEVQRGSLGWEAGLGLGTGSELGEPPAGLGRVHHPPSSSTSILPLIFLLPFPSFSSLLGPVTKRDLKPTGPDPRTGLSSLAYQELPQRSPDTVIEGERGKQICRDKAVAFFV